MRRDHLTYRYPRTLTEAFGCDADSANPIEGPYRSEWEGLADVLFATAIGLMLAWGLYYYFGG